MKKPAKLYWTALAVTGLGSLILLAIGVAFFTGQDYARFARGGYGGRAAFLADESVPGRAAEYGGEGIGCFMRSGGRFHGGGAWALLILLPVAVLVAAGFHRHRHGRDGNDVGLYRTIPDPLADLAEAYAAGSLSRAEYLERKTVLEERV